MGAPTSVAAYRRSESVVEVFYVTDSAGAAVTGLVNGNFTKYLMLDGAASATVVTVAEISNGHYKSSFTPGSVGHWSVRVNHATYGDWLGSWNVFLSDAGDLDYLEQTALPTSGLTSGTILDILRSLEAYDGKGKRLTWTYDSSDRVSSIALVLSFDAFVTSNHSYTVTYTYGDAANPLRPTVVTWQ